MTKRKHSVGYFSSYDRGLVCLLELWPEVRKAVPDATLDIYYGWNSFDNAHRSNPEMMKWKWGVIRQLSTLREQGVTEHGRVDHKTLAEKMKEIEVLAYPTEFTEVHMITMLKAQEAGLHCVHTGVAAISETGKHGTIVSCTDIYTNKGKQAEFVQAVIDALNKPTPSKQIDKPYWSDVAKVWSGVCA